MTNGVDGYLQQNKRNTTLEVTIKHVNLTLNENVHPALALITMAKVRLTQLILTVPVHITSSGMLICLSYHR